MKNMSPIPKIQWTDEQRQAALTELEQRFHTHLTEPEVFQAAALFLGLLRDGTFIDREMIASRVRLEGTLPDGQRNLPVGRES